MKMTDLAHEIAASGKRYLYQFVKDGIVIHDTEHDTYTLVTFEAVRKHEWPTIKAACEQGRNIDHVTRVTGYFSRTSGWNKGKTAELKDRARVGLGETTADGR